MKLPLRIFVLPVVAVVISGCGDPVPGPTPEQVPVPGSTEYPHALVKESVFAAGTGKEFRLFEPDGPPLLTAPVVVFLHGWGGMEPAYYRPWVDHLTRRGNVVLWVRYQESLLTLSFEFVPNMLAAVKAGLEALEQDPSRPKPERDKLAVVGHSMGGVLTMTLAARAASEGLPPFKAVLTAHPGTGITGPEVLADFSLIPASTLLLCVSGEEDPDLGPLAGSYFHQASSVPLENKDFIMVRSDRRFAPELVADHFAPNCLSEGDVNALDRMGYWKWFDGLLAAAFYGRHREYALGNTPEQRNMGTWPDGTPILEPLISDAP